jgi:quinol monooxygenase YgiN
MPAMFLAGMAWITTANTLSVSITAGLPDWVRARGMSLYQMAIMGASALGAALWGQVAEYSSLSVSVGLGALSGALAMWLTNRLMPDAGQPEDLTPRRIFQTPEHPEPPRQGHVLVTVEYRVAPERAAEFRRLMLGESRAARLRQGALSWELLHDLNEPERFIEAIVDNSWTDHLRRFERITAADAELHQRKLAFHIGAEPPRVARHLLESTVKQS